MSFAPSVGCYMAATSEWIYKLAATRVPCDGACRFWPQEVRRSASSFRKRSARPVQLMSPVNGQDLATEKSGFDRFEFAEFDHSGKDAHQFWIMFLTSFSIQDIHDFSVSSRMMVYSGNGHRVVAVGDSNDA